MLIKPEILIEMHFLIHSEFFAFPRKGKSTLRDVKTLESFTINKRMPKRDRHAFK